MPVRGAYAACVCGCLVALAAIISPRLAIFLVWLFEHDRMSTAFGSFWLALVGFLLLPWTTLAWAVVHAPGEGVTGFGWFVVTLAFLVDVATHLGGYQARREPRP